MATPLDLGLLGVVDFIFPFLLVWAFMFAMLQKTKIIGDAMVVNALIATVAGFTVLLSRTVVDLINFMIPWFAIAIIFFILLLLLFMIMGYKEINAYQDPGVRWVLIAVGILIAFAAFGKVLGQSLLEQAAQPTEVQAGDGGGVASESFQQSIFLTIFHPKVLGLLIVFAIAVFTVALMSG
ncbi:MAG TPA: hypothetical protein VJA18_00630 [Candidatus Nanoarchaeia archaeon]|nr:hypothetical protein [Candidatus Nanoarchaeia archaeon]